MSQIVESYLGQLQSDSNAKINLESFMQPTVWDKMVRSYPGPASELLFISGTVAVATIILGLGLGSALVNISRSLTACKRACKANKSDTDFNICNTKCKIEVINQRIKLLKAGISKCSKTDDVTKCKEKIQKQLSKSEQELLILKQKLKSQLEVKAKKNRK